MYLQAGVKMQESDVVLTCANDVLRWQTCRPHCN